MDAAHLNNNLESKGPNVVYPVIIVKIPFTTEIYTPSRFKLTKDKYINKTSFILLWIYLTNLDASLLTKRAM